MHDSTPFKVICLILALVTVFGGINYWFIADGKDLISFKDPNTKKNAQKLIAVCALLFLIMKIWHHFSEKHSSPAMSFYY